MTDTLIKRLEEATCGSPELDALIHSAAMIPWVPQEYVAPFSTSIDTALTLVPEGWRWDANAVGDNWCHARMWEPSGGGYQPHDRGYEADTPALAICIAALKARQS